MPRAARKVSCSGIYHIMIRGINREKIFKTDGDKRKYIQIMIQIKKKKSYELYAYCLMDNHAHFLIKENESSISSIMKEICGKYGAWFNYRYGRIGHLFQDRFKSECVETDTYFITVLKYILNNPVKAGIANELGEYKWDSYQEYLKKPYVTDTEYVLSMMSKNNSEAIRLFIDEMKSNRDEIANLTIYKVRRTDQEAEGIIEDELKKMAIIGIGELTGEKRNQFIKQLKAKGVSCRQIVGITGIPRRTIEGV